MGYRARGVQDICLAIGKDGCLALCYSYVAHNEAADAETIAAELIRDFNELAECGIIRADDCYVNDANALMRMYGSTRRVEKTTFDRAKSSLRVVCYKADGKGHWVVMNAQKEIVFNSLSASYCVRYGEPDFNDVRAFYRGAVA